MTKLSKKEKEKLMKEYGGRLPTKEEIFQKIAESQERMMQALKGAYESMPEDDSTRKEFIDAVEKAAKLRSRIYKDVLKKSPPKLKK